MADDGAPGVLRRSGSSREQAARSPAQTVVGAFPSSGGPIAIRHVRKLIERAVTTSTSEVTRTSGIRSEIYGCQVVTSVKLSLARAPSSDLSPDECPGGEACLRRCPGQREPRLVDADRPVGCTPRHHPLRSRPWRSGTSNVSDNKSGWPTPGLWPAQKRRLSGRSRRAHAIRSQRPKPRRDLTSDGPAGRHFPDNFMAVMLALTTS